MRNLKSQERLIVRVRSREPSFFTIHNHSKSFSDF